MVGRMDGTILPTTSGHQIHPPHQVLEATVVGSGGGQAGLEDCQRDMTRCTARTRDLAGGLLLLSFAAIMTIALGVKAPLDFFVFAAVAGVFLLAAITTDGRPNTAAPAKSV